MSNNDDPKWTKDANAFGGNTTYPTYNSPYSDNPSANSIQGKNLTFGILTNSFDPCQPSPITASNTVGAAYLDRWNLAYSNPNIVPGAHLQGNTRYSYVDTDANSGQKAVEEAAVDNMTQAALSGATDLAQVPPVTVPAPTPSADVVDATIDTSGNVVENAPVSESYRKRRGKTEKFAGYYIPGLRGSEIVTESFCGFDLKPTKTETACICVFISIVGIILLYVFFSKIYKQYKQGKFTGGFKNKLGNSKFIF